jgi:hypothetical protein
MVPPFSPLTAVVVSRRPPECGVDVGTEKPSNVPAPRWRARRSTRRTAGIGRSHERLPTAHELSLKPYGLSPWTAGLRGTLRRPAPTMLGAAGPYQEGQPQGAQGAGSSAGRLPFAPALHSVIRPTPRISCEAVPPSIPPAGAQGGTSARSTGAALSFVSCIRLFGGLTSQR